MKLLFIFLYIIGIIWVPLFEQLLVRKLYQNKESLPKYFLNKNLKIHFLKNSGMILGFLKNKRWIVLLITSLLMILLLGTSAYVFISFENLYILKTGLILLSSGAMSNALERFIFKFVIDYISFPKFFIKRIRNVVYNIPDFLIIIGSLIIMIGSFFI